MSGSAPNDERALGDMKVARDATAGAWVAANVHDWGSCGAWFPEVFPAYARVLHPAYRYVDQLEQARECAPTHLTLAPGTSLARTVWHQEVGWTEVARANSKVAHPLMEWASITGSYRFLRGYSQPSNWLVAPENGTLALRQTKRLATALAEHTRTPDLCWLAIWEGWDALPDLDELDVPRLRMPGRNMVLLFGPITALVRTSFLDLWYSHSTNPANWYRSPSLWWTADRSWCVATDVDLKSTYLGGSRECVSVLTSNNRLEVFEASAPTGHHN